MTGWVTPPTFTGTDGTVVHDSTFQKLSDDLVAINGDVMKTADQSVTSSTVLVNDTHLLYTIPVVGSYVFDVYLYVVSAANAAGHLNVGFTFPTGTCYAGAQGLTTALASGSSGTAQIAGGPITSGTAFVSLGASTTSISVQIHGRLVATATGTLRLQWAQAVSNASATTLKTGSHMRVRQVA